MAVYHFPRFARFARNRARRFAILSAIRNSFL